MLHAGNRQSVRHVTAVLVAEYGPGAASGADDTPAVVGTLEFFRAAGGDAEPLRPGAVVAVFDAATSAATAATRLHLRAAARADPDEPQWRVGLHVGEVLMTGDGSALLNAIDRATALARLARPGTTAIAADAVAACGPIHDADLVPLETVDLPGTFEGGVCLVVPRWSAPALTRRRLVAVLAGTAALGGVASTAWIVANHVSGGNEPLHVTLGVGPFRSSGSDPARAWIGPALRDGLDTQLSELSGVRLFSDEFLDFLMSRKGMTALEVATHLGIEKMVSGTVVTMGDTVRVEVRIVDVATGLFEGGYVVSGRVEDFLALETEVVLGVTAKLGLRLTAEDEQRFAAHQATDLDALRRVLRSEGETHAAPVPDLSPPEGPSRGPDPHSSLWDRLAPRAAHAEEPDADVAAFLEEYRRAMEARDVAGLGAMYVPFSPEQRAGLEEYFASVRDLRLRIERVEVAVVGEEAVASYTRTDDFVDVPTGRPLHVSLRLTKTLRRVGGRWRFVK